MDEYSNISHPWGDFLECRKKVIKWMREENMRNDKEISIILSMDEQQVFLIRTSKFFDESPKIAQGRHDFPISYKSTEYPNG